MFESFQPWVQIFTQISKSKARRRLGSFFLLAILLSIIIDLVDGARHSDLAEFWGTIGAGGGSLFFGVNLLRFPPDVPSGRWLWGCMGLLSIVGGSIGLIVGLMSIWLY